MMSEKGFAIRCPHCLKWNEYELHPKDVTISSGKELQGILTNLQKFSLKGEEDDFYHPKLFRCQSPRSLCPASFEAFIGTDGVELFKYAKAIKSWSLIRRFRLWKKNRIQRWDRKEKYVGILFNTQPVKRMQYIELGSIMDYELIRRIISGMSLEIQAPLTIFVNKVFNKIDLKEEPVPYWIPIEGYSEDNKPVPPGFNHFCAACRSEELKYLIADFEKQNPPHSPQNCILNYGNGKRCGGREGKPACQQGLSSKMHCPVFVENRMRYSACYNSDLEHLQSVMEKWKNGLLLEYGLVHRCKAGFLEIAFPISVHNHLIAIAMTGQFFRKPNEIVNPREYINSYATESLEQKLAWESIRNSEDVLTNAKYVLVGTEIINANNDSTEFLLNPKTTRERLRHLHDSINLFRKSAEVHYRDCRLKNEAAFRQELTGYVMNHCDEQNFFGESKGIKNKTCLGYILKRMQNFWAFKINYLLHYTDKNQILSLLGRSALGETEGFGIPGEFQRKVDIKLVDMHPCRYLHIDKELLPSDKRLKTLIPITEEITKKINLGNQDHVCNLLVLIPHHNEIFIFVLAVRDVKLTNAKQSPAPYYVSNLCQDAILATCTSVIHTFDNIKPLIDYREEHLKLVNKEHLKDKKELKENIKAVTKKVCVITDSMDEDLKKVALSKEEFSAKDCRIYLDGIQEHLDKILSYCD